MKYNGLKSSTRFFIFFIVVIGLNIFYAVCYHETKLDIFYLSFLSDLNIGVILFALYSYSGSRQTCQVERFSHFLNAYLDREKYINKTEIPIENSDNSLIELNQNLEKEFKILSLYIVNTKFQKKLYEYVIDWNGKNSDDLIEFIKEEIDIMYSKPKK